MAPTELLRLLREPLVTHETDDERVPVTVAEWVKAAAPDLVTLETFPNAQHTEAWNWDAARFEGLVGSFLSGSR